LEGLVIEALGGNVQDSVRDLLGAMAAHTVAVSTSLAVADLRLAPSCCRDVLCSYGFCAA
jgi:hypothetical protein